MTVENLYLTQNCPTFYENSYIVNSVQPVFHIALCDIGLTNFFTIELLAYVKYNII